MDANSCYKGALSCGVGLGLFMALLMLLSTLCTYVVLLDQDFIVTQNAISLLLFCRCVVFSLPFFVDCHCICFVIALSSLAVIAIFPLVRMKTAMIRLTFTPILLSTPSSPLKVVPPLLRPRRCPPPLCMEMWASTRWEP